MRLALSLVISIVTAGCTIEPNFSLASARRGCCGDTIYTRLEEGPVLVRQGEHYTLRYRFSKPPEGKMFFKINVFARRDADAGYYFFLGGAQSSTLEHGSLQQLPLAEDGLDDLARAGRVYWLDPDGTRTPIPIQATP